MENDFIEEPVLADDDDEEVQISIQFKQSILYSIF
jgi:hypothetical protein